MLGPEKAVPKTQDKPMYSCGVKLKVGVIGTCCNITYTENKVKKSCMYTASIISLQNKNSHNLKKNYSQEMAGFCCCSIQNWEDIYDKSELLVGQKRVEADEYHTRSDEDLKPLVQGNTEGHQKEAGGHGPGQR